MDAEAESEIPDEQEQHEGGQGEDPARDEPPAEPPHVEPASEGREAKGIRDPRAPTREQRAEHELTHANFRDWCSACVKGRGIAAAHRKQHEDEPSGVPAVHYDYCFMGISRRTMESMSTTKPGLTQKK